MPNPELLWEPQPSQRQLTDTDVHVWAAGLDQPVGQISSLDQLLSPDEQDRARKFKFENGRERFIAGRGLLRTILGSYLQADPVQLRFTYSPRGKPSLENTFGHGPLHFNVAHSQNLILIAVTRACPVGVDVEWIHPIRNFEDIAARFFSRNEAAKLKVAPVSERMAAFYSLWTRKEAYLKATGDGLSDALGEIEFTFLPEEPPRILTISDNAEAAQRWSVSDLKPATGFAAAIAAESKDLRLSCWQWPL